MVISRQLERRLLQQRVLQAGVSAPLNQYRNDPRLVCLSSVMEWRPPIGVERVDVGAKVQQLRDHEHLVALHEDSVVQRGPARVILHVHDVRRVLGQQGQDLGLPGIDRVMQGVAPAVVLLKRVSIVVHEHLHHKGVPVLACIVQGRLQQLVPRLDVPTLVEEKLNEVLVAELRGDVERRSLALLLD